MGQSTPCKMQDDPTQQPPPRAAGFGINHPQPQPGGKERDPAAGSLQAGDAQENDGLALATEGFQGLSGEPRMSVEKDEEQSKPRARTGPGVGCPQGQHCGGMGEWCMGPASRLSRERQVGDQEPSRQLGASGTGARAREPGWGGFYIFQTPVTRLEQTPSGDGDVLEAGICSGNAN